MDGTAPAAAQPPAAPLITKPGVYDIPAERYHADQLCDVPSLSSSIAKVLVTETPRHAWAGHPRLNPAFEPEVKNSFDAGSAAHALILGQRELLAVIDAPDFRTNKAKEARDAARAARLVPILAGNMEEAERMERAIRAQILMHEDFPFAFSNGRPEQTLVWFEGEGADRIACRIRLDWLMNRGGVLFDLKSTATNAGYDWPRRTLFDIGGDVQAAFYRRGVRAVLGVENPTFVFVVIENFAPYCMMMHTLEPETQALADAKVEYAIQWWRWCIKHGAWPAYPRRTNWVEAPPWEKQRAEVLRYAKPEMTDEEERALMRACEAWQAPALPGPAPAVDAEVEL